MVIDPTYHVHPLLELSSSYVLQSNIFMYYWTLVHKGKEKYLGYNAKDSKF